MLQIYNRVITTGNLYTLMMLTAIMLIALAFMYVFDWVRHKILQDISARYELKVLPKLYDREFKSKNTGTKKSESNIGLSDLSIIKKYMLGQGIPAYLDCLWTPIYILVLFGFHQYLGTFACFCLFLIATINRISSSLEKPLPDVINEKTSKPTDITVTTPGTADSITAMGLQKDFQKKWIRLKEQHFVEEREGHDLNLILGTISKSIRQIAQSLILGLGCYLVVSENLSAGIMIASSILLGRILSPFDIILKQWKNFVSAKQCFKSIEALTDISRPLEITLPISSTTITLKNTQFSAHEQRFAGKSLDFEFDHGKIHLIIGPSGSGKSNLCRTILGITPPQTGEVCIGDIDVKHLTPENRRSLIGFVPQDPEVLDGTIIENISGFDLYNVSKAIRAAKRVGLHESILKLPNNYGTKISQNSQLLSNGQKQLLALARALYANPGLIVLDEIDSKLDQSSRSALTRLLFELRSEGKNLIITSKSNDLSVHANHAFTLQAGTLERLEKLSATKSLASSRHILFRESKFPRREK